MVPGKQPEAQGNGGKCHKKTDHLIMKPLIKA